MVFFGNQSYQYESINGHNKDKDNDDDDDEEIGSFNANGSRYHCNYFSKGGTFTYRKMTLLGLTCLVVIAIVLVGNNAIRENGNNDKNNRYQQVKSVPPLVNDNSNSNSDDQISSEQNDGSTTSAPTKASSTSSTSTSTSSGNNNSVKGEKEILPMPTGVNLGSWLSLESYFFVGNKPQNNERGHCLPPLHVGQDASSNKGPAEGAGEPLPSWDSETGLLADLINTTGVANAIKIFHAHRNSFISDQEIKELHDLGIQNVRVPISWCLTDYDPEKDMSDKNITDAELLDRFTCEDPFFVQEGMRWPAIPRSFLANFLRKCNYFGIQVLLDIHTYPGATSTGGFSGIPQDHSPRFWMYDNPSDPYHDVGRNLFNQFIAWLEQLDSYALEGLLGVGAMNEPAHMNVVDNFLPPLSEDVAQKYLDELDHDRNIPDGSHLRFLLWLSDAIQVFRNSSLPHWGKELHINVIESAFQPSLLPEGLGTYQMIASWWNRTTKQEERESWAVLDIHHYHAWSPPCQGAVDGPPSGNYSCTDGAAREKALARCSQWATDSFRPFVDLMCGGNNTARIMSGEFSTSTHPDMYHACHDVDTLKRSYTLQIQNAAAANVDLYFWSYKMPYAGVWRNAWSFKELMHRFGVSNNPDEENFSCGEN